MVLPKTTMRTTEVPRCPQILSTLPFIVRELRQRQAVLTIVITQKDVTKNTGNYLMVRIERAVVSLPDTIKEKWMEVCGILALGKQRLQIFDFKASAVYRASPGRPRLHRETLSLKSNNRKENK